MTPAQIDRVFGRERLKMVTGEHVEVYREAVAPGEPRRYTKRFLATPNGDFGPWTEREWRILARLIGHGIRCVPEVVQFDAGAKSGMRSVQTCDAGVTVDQWATLVPVARDGTVRGHIFEDSAHWWSLAHYCLAALSEIHALELVHLDIKADNICIPYAPADFEPDGDEGRLYPAFARLALIDFAFSLVSRESLALPLPLGWQKDYDYQSPRLLKALEAGRNGDLEPTRVLDWRCDFYSLAAMLKRYLPSDRRGGDGSEMGWTSNRYDDARSLIFRLRDTHDRDLPHWRPHAELIDFCAARLDEPDLVASLQKGWTLARGEIVAGMATPITPITPVTRIAPFARAASVTPLTHIASSEPIVLPGLAEPSAARGEMAAIGPDLLRMKPRAVRSETAAGPHLLRRTEVQAPWRAKLLLLSLVAGVAASAPPFIGNPAHPLFERASPASGERNATSPVQAPRSSLSSNGAAAPAAPEADPANPADDANDRVARSQRDQVADAPEPATSIGTSGGLANDEPRPTSETPREQAIVANAAPAPVATPAEKVSSSSDATTREQAAPNAAQTRVKSVAPAKRAPVTSWSPSNATPTQHGRRPSSAPASARVRSVPHPPAPVVARSTSPSRARVATASPAVNAYLATLSPRSSSPSVAGQSTPPIAQVDATPAGVGASMTVAIEDSRASAPLELAPARAPESVADQRSPAAPAKPAPKASRAKSGWQGFLGSIVGLLQGRDRPAVPVEDRDVRRSQVVPQSPMPQQLAAAASNPIPRPPSRQLALAPTTPGVSPNPTAPGLRSGATSDGAPSATISLAALNSSSAESRTPESPPAIAAPPHASVEPPMLARSAPDESFGARADSDKLTIEAKRMLANAVPRVATQAQHDVTPVLRTAGLPPHPMQAETIAQFAHAKWTSEDEWISASDLSPSYARILHSNARQALASGRGAANAANIELRAFGANPHDPEIAAYLAYLYLRAEPVQPETARELALHAIVVSGPRRSARAGDWGVLAVASALTGREADATRALLVEVALTKDLDATCRAALSAYSYFGERLRVPVQAMLSRVHALGGAYAYPSCASPPFWANAARRPSLLN